MTPRARAAAARRRAQRGASSQRRWLGACGAAPVRCAARGCASRFQRRCRFHRAARRARALRGAAPLSAARAARRSPAAAAARRLGAALRARPRARSAVPLQVAAMRGAACARRVARGGRARRALRRAGRRACARRSAADRPPPGRPARDACCCSCCAAPACRAWRRCRRVAPFARRLAAAAAAARAARGAARAMRSARGLRWIEDPTQRGRALRPQLPAPQVLPPLRARWPAAAGDAWRAARATLAEAQQLLDDVAGAATARGAPTARRCAARRCARWRRRGGAMLLRHWLARRGVCRCRTSAPARGDRRRAARGARRCAAAASRWPGGERAPPRRPLHAARCAAARRAPARALRLALARAPRAGAARRRAR